MHRHRGEPRRRQCLLHAGRRQRVDERRRHRRRAASRRPHTRVRRTSRHPSPTVRRSSDARRQQSRLNARVLPISARYTSRDDPPRARSERCGSIIALTCRTPRRVGTDHIQPSAYDSTTVCESSGRCHALAAPLASQRDGASARRRSRRRFRARAISAGSAACSRGRTRRVADGLGGLSPAAAPAARSSRRHARPRRAARIRARRARPASRARPRRTAPRAVRRAPPHRVAGRANEPGPVDRLGDTDGVEQLRAAGRKRDRQSMIGRWPRDQVDGVAAPREQPRRRGAGRAAAEHDDGRQVDVNSRFIRTSASNASVMTRPARFTCTKIRYAPGSGNPYGNDTVEGDAVCVSARVEWQKAWRCSSRPSALSLTDARAQTRADRGGRTPRDRAFPCRARDPAPAGRCASSTRNVNRVRRFATSALSSRTHTMRAHHRIGRRVRGPRAVVTRQRRALQPGGLNRCGHGLGHAGGVDQIRKQLVLPGRQIRQPMLERARSLISRG